MATKIGINGFGRIGRSFDNRMTDRCLFGGFFVCLLACLLVCLFACLFVCLLGGGDSNIFYFHPYLGK